MEEVTTLYHFLFPPPILNHITIVAFNFIIWWLCEKRKKEWKVIFKEISEIIGLNISMSPIIVLLNISKDQLVNENKDLIVIMIMAARIIIARNWRNENQFNLEEWYRELWDMAINDKLTCDRGQMKNNDFKKIWNVFLEHVFRRGRGFTCLLYTSPSPRD